MASRTVLFDPMQPQKAQAILRLSRTSDVRQRDRISGAIKGEFRSVAPDSDDTEFDTVSFDEVLRRLRWARGWLGKLLAHLNNVYDRMIIAEVKQLMWLLKRRLSYSMNAWPLELLKSRFCHTASARSLS